MKRLFLDTSNKYLYILITDDDQKLYEISSLGNNNHSEVLADKLKEALTSCGLKASDIDEIYVGKGPGSYTGLRVSCTTSKVLAYALNLKLFSFSSLDLLLTTYPDLLDLKDGIIIPIMDARRGFSYVKGYKIENGEIHLLFDETYINSLELKEQYPNALYLDTDNYNFNPLVLLKLKLFEEVQDIHAFVPTYLRSGVS